MESTELKTESLSIFFPAYNDAATIGNLVTSFLEEGRHYAENIEVIVVNDGSSDDTAAVLNDLALQLPELRVIHHPENRGYGAALITGFMHCRSEMIFYTDGDAQYRASDLHSLFAALTPETDVVNGYKIARSDNFVRVLVGNLYKCLTRLCFGIRMRDVDCDYRLIRRKAMEPFQLKSATGVICTEMVYQWQKHRCRIAEVPVHHYPREHGSSQFFSLRHLRNAVFGLIGLWFRLHFRK